MSDKQASMYVENVALSKTIALLKVTITSMRSHSIASVLLSSSEVWESFDRNPKDFSSMVKKVKKKVKWKAGLVCAALPVQVLFRGNGEKAKMEVTLQHRAASSSIFVKMVQSTLVCGQVTGEKMCAYSQDIFMHVGCREVLFAHEPSFNRTCQEKLLRKHWKLGPVITAGGMRSFILHCSQLHDFPIRRAPICARQYLSWFNSCT